VGSGIADEVPEKTIYLCTNYMKTVLDCFSHVEDFRLSEIIFFTTVFSHHRYHYYYITKNRWRTLRLKSHLIERLMDINIVSACIINCLTLVCHSKTLVLENEPYVNVLEIQWERKGINENILLIYKSTYKKISITLWAMYSVSTSKS
jgi:hypothetical protein